MRKFFTPKILAMSLLVITLIVAIAAVLIINSQKKTESPESSIPDTTDTAIDTATVAETVEESADISKNRILFIEDLNVWVMNPDGTSRQQLTTDGGTEFSHPELGTAQIYYTALSWQKPGIASYAKCHVNCVIQTYDLGLLPADAERVYPETNLGNGFLISAQNWSEIDGQDVLVFLLLDAEAAIEDRVLMWSSDMVEPLALYSYSERLGRGVGIEDNLSVKFSPENTYVSVQNTFSTGEDEQIIVFDTETWNIVKRLGNTFLGHVFVEDSVLMTSSTTPDGVQELYETTLIDESLPVAYMDGMVPFDSLESKVTGTYVNALGVAVLTEADLDTRLVEFLGTDLVNVEYLGNTEVYLGHKLFEDTMATYPRGIYRFEVTATGPVTTMLSETSGRFSIER